MTHYDSYYIFALQQQQGATTTWMLECTRHAVRTTASTDQTSMIESRSQALLAVTGRGWLWGKEEEVSKHDSSHSLVDENTITENISMDVRAQAEAFFPIESIEHNERMMLQSSTYPNIR
jgi:hypothetical protein